MGATRLSGLVLKELSLVDDPANVDSTVSIFKRRERVGSVEPIVKAVASLMKAVTDGAVSFDEAWAKSEADRKSWQAQDALYPLFDALRNSMSSIAGDQALSETDKRSKIEASVAAFLAAVKKALPDVEENLVQALAASPDVAPYMKRARKETDVEKDAQIAALTKQNTELTASLADVNKKLEASTTELTKAKTDLAAATTEIEKAKAGPDETIIVAGQEIKKSVVGAGTFAAFKAQQDDLQVERIQKRVSAEIPSLPGDDIRKGKALLAITKIADQEARETVEAMLKAGNAAMATYFKEVGRVGDLAKGSADEELEKGAQKYAAEQKISIEKARVAFLDTADGHRLYAQSVNEQRARARAA